MGFKSMSSASFYVTVLLFIAGYGEHGEYQGKLLLYNRAELKTSDHRPVMALLECEMVCVDEARRQEVFKVREIVSDALLYFSSNLINRGSLFDRT